MVDAGKEGVVKSHDASCPQLRGLNSDGNSNFQGREELL